MSLQPTATEHSLSWGQTLRGVRWHGVGNPILLLHEPGTDLDAWGLLPATISSALQANVYAYDLPGFGLSDDPWQPERLPEIMRDISHHVSTGRPLALLSAGQCATTTLHLAPALPLLGLVCLSPDAPAAPPPRSPTVPKLFVAGAQAAADDLTAARHLASTCGGWTLVTSIPTHARGTAFFATEWSNRIAEQITGFLRNCIHRHSRRPTAPHSRLDGGCPLGAAGGEGLFGRGAEMRENASP